MIDIDRDTIVIEREDYNFPKGLLDTPDCPLKLYALGNIELLNHISIAIVGTRSSSEFGNELAKNISKNLSNYNITIISGMADGIDENSHIGTYNAGSTIAVVAGGFKTILRGNKLKRAQEILNHNGLIISEYHPEFIVRKALFLQRNRLIAGISSATVVIEAPIASGAISTANHALRYKRPLYAIPWSLNHFKGEGCNLLFRQGAMPLIDYKQLLIDLKIIPTQINFDSIERTTKVKTIPNEYLKYYEFIEHNSPCLLEAIIDAFNEEFIGNVISTLTLMELNNYIKSSDKGYYIS
ncbi:MAG: DNA-processing protein DprA [Clostridia bacterium]|nr:DNA-processing protein DprA [Clostridia bacterium]